MKKFIFFLSITVISALGVSGQSYWSYDDHSLSLKMPEISLVSVMPANYSVNLSLGLPKYAGEKPGKNADSKDNNTWLNYSCGLRPNGSYRKVYVQITSGTVPDGLKVYLRVKNLRKAGVGRYGRRYSSRITLSNQPQIVVNRIGGGCTYRGRTFGHQLIYTLKLDDIDDLVVEDTKTYLTITYTISD
ncbi:MAG: hypothetical protein ACI9JN_001651 [Bacteroidia bacterium]|jgi:hypothetical protein